jgi:hypothetical protein
MMLLMRLDVRDDAGDGCGWRILCGKGGPTRVLRDGKGERRIDEDADDGPRSVVDHQRGVVVRVGDRIDDEPVLAARNEPNHEFVGLGAEYNLHVGGVGHCAGPNRDVFIHGVGNRLRHGQRTTSSG